MKILQSVTKCLILQVFIIFLAGCYGEEISNFNKNISKEDNNNIIRIISQLEKHWNNGEIDSMEQYYDNNIVQMPPKQLSVKGRSTLFSRWKLYQEEYNDHWKPYVEKVVISGDLAVVQGRFVQKSILKGSTSGLFMYAKSIYVFKRDTAGNWKMIIDIWNESEPRKTFSTQNELLSYFGSIK